MLRLLLFVSALTFSCLAADSGRPVIHVGNFALVNQHLLRGAEPTVIALNELGAAGVKIVIDLRESSAATRFEKEQVERLGMKYDNVPFPPMSAPSPTQVRAVLDLIAQNQSNTIFVHCHRGKDRTGTVVACYRVQHDGWGNDKALDEARHYGMSVAERGMRSFILHFTPVSNFSDPLLLNH